jgi:hypothetical protein
MSKLVPGELVLEEDLVERAKAAINAGEEIESPRVSPIGTLYYVRDGNHRIMAMKLLGQDSILCRIHPHHPPQGVADHDADKCQDAVEKGYLGFSGVKLGSREEKAKAYDDEDDICGDFGLEGDAATYDCSTDDGDISF